MRGLAFHDTATGRREACRGRTSLLFRPVADADPLVAEMRRRDIPYVVKGLNRLFDSPEITPSSGCSATWRARRGARSTSSLAGREPCPANGDWAAALAVLDEGRDFDRGERWGVYNIQRLYLEFLAALGVREETVSG